MNRELLRLAPAWVFLFILPFTHTVALRLMGLFTAAALMAWQWQRVRTPPLTALPAWRWILFWALLPLLLLPFSADPRYSLGEVKTEVVYGMLALFVFFTGIRDGRGMTWTLYVLMAAFLIMTGWALGSRVYLGYWKEDSYFGGIGSYSVYLVTVMPVLVLVWHERLFGRWSKEVVVTLALLGLAAGFFTQQRALWFAFGAQGAVLALLLRRAHFWTPRPWLSWATVGLIVLAASLTVLEVSLRRSSAGLAYELLADPRLQNWHQVFAWTLDRPLSGFGFGRGMMAKAFPEMWGRPDAFWHAHNVVFNYGFQLGVPGILTIVGVFGALGWHWLRLASNDDVVLRAVGITGVLLVVGVFVRNMTNDLFQRDLALLFWSINGILAGYARTRAVRAT